MAYNHNEVERKWQDIWFRERINESHPDKRKKFFIHFAYPGISGYLHIGHMRGFTYADVIARYKRMHGYNVLFPAGFHASGLPAVSLAKRIERKDNGTIKSLIDNGCPEEVVPKLSDPEFVVKFFSEIYVEDYWKRFGFLIDYSRQMTTISPGYKRFIQWQFRRLNDAGLLVQKPHYAPFCPNCGPVAVDPSETDVSRGGSAEIQEFIVLKFKMEDGTILPAATLRPETVFGVTNMWLNPDVDYVKAGVDGEVWIISQTGAEKLKYQGKTVEIIGSLKGSELIGKDAIAPLVDRKVPVLAGKFVDPDKTTGVVMSVPAHAPYDWIALKDLGVPVEPMVIIDIEGYNIPAKEICEAMGISNQQDTEKLDLATEEIYKKEFHTGILNQNCGEYAGKRISEVKDMIRDDLISRGLGDDIREFSELVICRCGSQVFIKQIPDQWFIRYSDANLTERSKQWAAQMNIYPKEYYEEMPKVLDWFGDRACIRRGSWLGTEFPFKKGWIIEPISDSTLYPAYYTLTNFVNNGMLKSEEMDDRLFDYVFLGKGEAPPEKKELWDSIKSEFDYWYPVDINLGGKEHKTVHFPVFLMNHVAVLHPEDWPRGIFSHWWVTGRGGEKMSKSKGGAEPIPGAVTKYGADALRLYYVHTGSPFIDIEWDPDAAFRYRSRIEKIWRILERIVEMPSGSKKYIDGWMFSVLNKRILAAEEAMKEYDLRRMANEIFFNFLDDIEWFFERGGSDKHTMLKVAEALIRLISPVTPHLAEECWSLLGKKMLVSEESYPAADPDNINPTVEAGEDLIKKTMTDISEILIVTGIKPRRIIVYVAPRWKREIFEYVLEKGGEVGEIIKWAMAKEDLRPYAKDIPQFVTKAVVDVKKAGDESARMKGVDELNVLMDASQTLARRFGCSIEVHSADEKDVYDPQEKSKNAIPGRPAIFIE